MSFYMKSTLMSHESQGFVYSDLTTSFLKILNILYFEGVLIYHIEL